MADHPVQRTVHLQHPGASERRVSWIQSARIYLSAQVSRGRLQGTRCALRRRSDVSGALGDSQLGRLESGGSSWGSCAWRGFGGCRDAAAATAPPPHDHSAASGSGERLMPCKGCGWRADRLGGRPGVRGILASEARVNWVQRGSGSCLPQVARVTGALLGWGLLYCVPSSSFLSWASPALPSR